MRIQNISGVNLVVRESFHDKERERKLSSGVIDCVATVQTCESKAGRWRRTALNNSSVCCSQNQQEPSFGHVIKARFFKVLPDSTKTQIQDQSMIKNLCRRLTYHLSCLEKKRKGRIDKISEFMIENDKDYKEVPQVRRLFNFNRSYDNCFYLITGRDCLELNGFAENCATSASKKSEIINRHWELARRSERRLRDNDGKELAVNIFLREGKHPKTGEDCFFLSEMKLIEEYKMHFPYRARNENLP